jgi:hypothetical protein
MKSKFDLLELYFQKFIEASADVLWHDERIDLVRKLIQAIETEMEHDQNTDSDLPAALTIFLPPHKYALWHAEKDLVDSFSAALQEAAVEVGLRTSNRPVIHLEIARNLMENDLQVHIIHPDKTTTKTAFITPENADGLPKKAAWSVKAFLILENGVHFPLSKSVINIGRRDDNELMVEDPHVSRDHAQIRLVNHSFILFDMNSTGGTFVNGRKIDRHTLQPGDVISVSNHPFIYVEEDHKPPENAPIPGSITHTTRIVTSSNEDKASK